MELVHNLLHSALKQAMKWGSVHRNVAELAAAPSIGSRKKNIMKADQIRQFLAACEHHRLHGLFHLVIATGMRRGELFGSRWANVHLPETGNGYVDVIDNAVELPGGVVLGTPKSGAGQRRLFIKPSTVAVLRRHCALQDEERAKQGADWQEHDLVFSSKYGTPLSGSRFNTVYKRLLKQAKLPNFRFHDLRHTHASLLFARGNNSKVVSDRLGHADPKFTEKTYIHVQDDLRNGVAFGLEDVLGPGKDEPPVNEEERPGDQAKE